jgi:hypothetical protein
MSIASLCTVSIARELSLPPTTAFLVYKDVHQIFLFGLRREETLWYTAGLKIRMSPGRKAIARPRVGNVKYNVALYSQAAIGLCLRVMSYSPTNRNLQFICFERGAIVHSLV